MILIYLFWKTSKTKPGTPLNKDIESNPLSP